VVCPPYDVISPEEQNYYHNLHPCNFTHIDLGKEKKNDGLKDNKYTRAKKIFDEWLKKGVMIQDERPCLYFYKQDYTVMGQKHSRLGFMSLMELQDEENSKVHPHENTHAHAVDDRLRLTRALHANLSPIFVCYSDKEKKVEKVFNKKIVMEPPLVNVTDHDGVKHRLWRLDEPLLIKEIDGSLDGQNLFIADGHHRYKVAQEYRRAKQIRRKSLRGQESFNFVMTYFTNLDSKDLQIFPMHRIIKHFPRDIEFLEKFFRVDKVVDKDDLLILLARAGCHEYAFGLYSRDGIKLLRLKNKLLINEYITKGSKEYRSLDAIILKAFVFDQIGIKSEDIIYTRDFQEAIQAVNRREADASFIMNPVKIEQLKAIALNGERMPPKTTYFYPKVLSGLAVYKMD